MTLKHYTVYTAAVVLLATLMYNFIHQNLIANWTESIPVGIYRRTTAGDFVLFCADDQNLRTVLPRGPCPSGRAPLLKPVVRAGIIKLTPAGAVADGVLVPHSAPKTHSRSGLPLNHCPYGIYRTTPDEIWPIAQHPDSYDARYICSVPRAAIISFAAPVLTWH